MGLPPLETCVYCDHETGFTGRTEDSIYATLNYPLWERLKLVAGSEIGPLCYDCQRALQQLEFIDQD